jgi:hypothetical protein
MFQRMIAWILRDLPQVVVYIDDVLIGTAPEGCGNILEMHESAVDDVLHRFRKSCLGAKGDKVFFFKTKIKFCGNVLSDGQRRAAPSKVQAIAQWKHTTITTVRRLKSFMCLAQHYAQYVRNFAGIALPLTEETKGTLARRLVWTPSMVRAFEDLKAELLHNVVLDIADPSKPYVMETDASDYAVGGVLSQHNDAGELRPVAFFSRKLCGSPGKGQMNWSIREK